MRRKYGKGNMRNGCTLCLHFLRYTKRGRSIPNLEKEWIGTDQVVFNSNNVDHSNEICDGRRQVRHSRDWDMESMIRPIQSSLFSFPIQQVASFLLSTIHVHFHMSFRITPFREEEEQEDDKKGRKEDEEEKEVDVQGGGGIIYSCTLAEYDFKNRRDFILQFSRKE